MSPVFMPIPDLFSMNGIIAGCSNGEHEIWLYYQWVALEVFKLRISTNPRILERMARLWSDHWWTLMLAPTQSWSLVRRKALISLLSGMVASAGSLTKKTDTRWRSDAWIRQSVRHPLRIAFNFPNTPRKRYQRFEQDYWRLYEVGGCSNSGCRWPSHLFIYDH